MANENINLDLSLTKTIIRCLNIWIYPDSIQNKYLNKYLGIYRLVYNITIGYIKEHKKTNFIAVRNEVFKLVQNKYPNND